MIQNSTMSKNKIVHVPTSTVVSDYVSERTGERTSKWPSVLTSWFLAVLNHSALPLDILDPWRWWGHFFRWRDNKRDRRRRRRSEIETPRRTAAKPVSKVSVSPAFWLSWWGFPCLSFSRAHSTFWRICVCCESCDKTKDEQVQRRCPF